MNNLIVQFSLSAFGHNILEIKKTIFPAKLCVVLKANSYGLSTQKLLPTAIKNGADYIGISSNAELRIVQNYDKKIPIIRLRPFLSNELNYSLKCPNMMEIIGSLASAKILSQKATKFKVIAKYHLSLDTGMGREGVLWDNLDEIKSILTLPNLEIVGLMTHFASSEELANPMTNLQYERFKIVEKQLLGFGYKNLITHVANSCGVLHNLDTKMVRAGNLLYGASYGLESGINLKNPIKIDTFLCDYKTVPKGWKIGYNSTFETTCQTTIGLLPVGYSDGIPKNLSGNFYIDNVKCPILGKISMNITVIDISKVKKPKIGQKVKILGENQSTNELAKSNNSSFGSIIVFFDLKTIKYQN
jgi:alanine racemase